MTKNALRLPSTGLALAASLAIGSVCVQAQEQEQEESELLEEIVVTAPWRVEREVVGRSAVGAPIEVVSLSRRVNYSDLDLTRHADVMELENRIDDMAHEACDQLAEMFPLDNPDTPMCVNEAIEGATAQAEDAIAAAGGQQQEVATAPEEQTTR